MVVGVEFAVSEEGFTPEPKMQSQSLRALCSKDFIEMKGQRKFLT